MSEWPRMLSQEEQKQAKWLLYVNPKNLATKEPLIDAVTLKMMRLWRTRRDNVEDAGSWRGFHTCVCRAMSSSTDHVIRPNERTLLVTNALCVHYLAHHRDEVPREVLTEILLLPDVPHEGEDRPTEKELRGWFLKGEKMKTRFG
jgi:hypothetical protein